MGVLARLKQLGATGLMMRPPALLALIALAACEPAGAPGAGVGADASAVAEAATEARVSLPLAAPADADRLLQDFIAICSRDMISRNEAALEAARRGWRADTEQAAMAAFGMMMFQPPEDLGSQGMLQLNAFNYPHLTGESCLMVQHGEAPLRLDFAVFGGLPGVQGEYMLMPAPGPERGGRGLYSFIGPDGEVVTITVVHAPPQILQMTMGTSRRVEPAPAAGPTTQ